MRAAAAVVFAAVALAASGCGGSGSSGSSHSIVVYNGQHLELTRSFIDAFKKATGISVHMRTDDSVVLADQILQEGHSSPADVYITENSPDLVNLQERGLLASLPPSVLEQVPAVDRSAAGKWVGLALRVSSLACNPSRISGSQIPTSVLDLTSPKWKGKIAIAPLDSDFPPVVGAVIATHGEKAAADWLAGMKRNASIYQDEESVVAAVNRGDVACGIVNHYYWYRLRREIGAGAMHSKLFFFPTGDPGSIVNVSGAGILASSHHIQDARRFVSFLVSPTGQKLIGHGDDYEYPVRPGIAANGQLPALASIPHTTLSASKLGDDRKAAKLVAAAGFGS
jgi:iron(III) transport system substrate-binding protein